MVKRLMKIKKSLITGILIVTSGILIGCNDAKETSSAHATAINEAKVAVASSEYDKAKNLFKLAIDEGGEDTTLATENYELLNNFLEAKKLFDSKEIEKAKKIIDEIYKIETYENLSEDINELKGKIDTEKNATEDISSTFIKVENLIKENKFSEALELLNSIKIPDNLETLLAESDTLRSDINKKKEEFIIAKAKKIISQEEEIVIGSVE